MSALKSVFVSALAAVALSLAGTAVAGSGALLGVQVGYPQTNFTAVSGQGASYDGATLTITSTPIFTTFIAGDAAQFVSSGNLQISAAIDSAGALSGGTFSLSGSVTDPNSFITYSGVLLSGTVLDYGMSNIGGPGGTDLSDFRLQATGGSMLSLMGGAEVGAVIALEGSNYSGSFAGAFSSTGAKGDIGPIPAPVTSPGTATQGYWKNHPDEWPVASLVLGGVNFSKSEAIDVLKTPTRGDKTISMAKQLIAAKLNVAAGNESSCIDDTIAAADTWLAGHGGVSSGQRSWDGGDLYHDNLDAYNNGQLCAPHRP